MNIFEIIALIIIGAFALTYLVFYLSKPFKKKNDPCSGCAFSCKCKKTEPICKNSIF